MYFIMISKHLPNKLFDNTHCLIIQIWLFSKVFQ